MPSGLEVIKRSMRIAGAIGQNETPSSSEADDGLIALNDMLDSWSTDRTYVYTIKQETFNLIDGQTSYTIGPGGDFNTERPIEIDNLVVNLNDQTFNLRPINAEDYASIGNKTITTGVPEYYYYDKSFPLGRIYIYGAAGTGYTISIGKWEQLGQFADLTTQYTLPPGYNRAIVYGLAMDIAPEYGMQLSQEAVATGIEARANIRNRNLPDPVMKTEIGYMVGAYGDRDRGW